MGVLTIEEQNSKKSLYVESLGFNSLCGDSTSLSTSQLLAKGDVPDSHRRVADTFMIIKRIYGQPIINCPINNQEAQLLAKYDFNVLEYSTIKQINDELSFLKKWSRSLDEKLKNDADKIIEIRCKELKFLLSSRYATITNEIYNGYLALEKYFEYISKYSY